MRIFWTISDRVISDRMISDRMISDRNIDLTYLPLEDMINLAIYSRLKFAV